ncbi:MAG: hypothetical protein K9M99_11350 [Candidatus Cloacimonetes bacterium]|nr:hypothetical protein [Candidatus Cloacimonadota bacterium]
MGYSSVERTGMYDLWGRKTTDPSKAVNSRLNRDEEMEYILYKYPVELDEEWILYTDTILDEDGEFVCEVDYKGRYDIDTTVEVAAGEFSVIRYEYFYEVPSEIPFNLEWKQRIYCKPGIGYILHEFSFDDSAVWERFQELIDFQVN